MDLNICPMGGVNKDKQRENDLSLCNFSSNRKIMEY